MKHHANQVGFGIASTSNVGSHFFAIDIVDHHFALSANAVGAIGVAQDSHFHAVDVNNVWTQSFASIGIDVSSCVRHLYAVEILNGAFQTRIAAVEAVIIGSSHEVEAHTLQMIGKFVGSAEARVSRIRFAAQRTLQIDQREIGVGYIVGDERETRRVVVRTVGALCSANLRAVLHGIAHKSEVDDFLACKEFEQREEQNG